MYGKSHRAAYNKGNAAFFDGDDEEDELALPAAKKARPSATVFIPKPMKAQEVQDVAKRSEPVARATPPMQSERAAVKAKPPKKQVDTFDVPSSDDEDAKMEIAVPEVPKRKIRNRLIKDPIEEPEQLAPWERRALATSHGSNTQDGGKTAAATKKSRPQLSPRKSAAEKAELTKEPSQALEMPATMSAKEKLAARRRQMQRGSASSNGAAAVSNATTSNKRSVAVASTQGKLQNKRRRTTPPVQPSMPEPEMAHQSDSATEGVDIFDVPLDEEPAKGSKLSPANSTSRSLSSRFRLLGRSSRRGTPQKAVSAPTRLTEMLPVDDEYAFPVGEDGSSPHLDDSPRKHSPTNGRGAPSTPKTTRSGASIHRSGSLTPKQVKLWDDFFQTASTPSVEMKKLSISDTRRTAKSTAAAIKPLARSSSDVPVKRTRTVDRLKADVVSSSDVEDSDDEDDSGTDAEMDDPMDGLMFKEVSKVSESQEQSMNQSQERKPEAGTKRTYAKSRSHLTEENADPAMMLDLPMQTPQRPAATARRIGKPAVAAKKSTFDTDDSDDAPAGGLRTIHELRAAGRNNRVMGEIEDLMSEIADHAVASKSRRRGALMDLTAKLSDKSFAEQFIAHGFENQLLAECNAGADAVADFLLAAALVTLFSADLPSHSTQSATVALAWLTGLLANSTDIARVAKDRRSNMSKAAQGDLVVFADKISVNVTLWGETGPANMTSRILALRSIELLISKLRAIGDRSELLDVDALSKLLPKAGFTGDLNKDTDRAAEACITISILEALSTLSAIGTWPKDVISAVAALPASFAESWQAPEHTKWLAYRLCLNITNEKSIDAAYFTEHDAVRQLLQAVVTSFDSLDQTSQEDDKRRALRLDLLLLAIGILINLAEYSTLARQQAVAASCLPALTSLVGIFARGQERALEAESVEDTAANVAYGYLAVMLANVCQDAAAKTVVRDLLPGKKLDLLVEGVEEFVRHHQKVDAMSRMEVEMEVDGDEDEADGKEKSKGGAEVWSGFTERLVGVLTRLKEV